MRKRWLVGMLVLLVLMNIVSGCHSEKTIEDKLQYTDSCEELITEFSGEKEDTDQDALLLCEKISKLRIFSDENDKMNLSLLDVNGEMLVVSNFTLNANYSHGNRPDYFGGASPDVAEKLY